MFDLLKDELLLLVAIAWSDDVPVMTLVQMRKHCVIEHSHVRFFEKVL